MQGEEILSLLSNTPKLWDVLELQEENRKKAIRTFYFWLAVALLPCGGLFYYCFYYTENRLLFCFYSVALFVCIFVGLLADALSKNKKVYKKEVLPLVIDILKETYNDKDTKLYYAAEYVPAMERYLFNPLFSHGNRILGEDRVYGRIHNAWFSFYEVNYFQRSSGKYHSTSTRFQGLAFVTELYRELEGETTISSGRPSGISFFGSSKYKKVQFTSSQFSNRFKVYTTSENDVRRMITPAFMERVLQLSAVTKKIRKGEVKIRLRGSALEIYIPSSKDRFEPNLFTKTTEKDVFKDFDVLEVLLSLVDVMKPAAEN